VRRPGLEPGRAADPRLSALLGSSKAGGPSAARGGRPRLPARLIGNPGPNPSPILRGGSVREQPAAGPGRRVGGAEQLRELLGRGRHVEAPAHATSIGSRPRPGPGPPLG